MEDPAPTTNTNHLKSWDSVLKTFFQETGLIQALRGFELDMLVLNPAWERETMPGALERLIENIKHSPEPEPDTLDDRKATYTDDLPPPSTVTKSIPQYLSRNRARNDASNRAEFLCPTSETSCARTDAKTLDRDSQMKYDIAKNDDGPLRRTTKKGKEEKGKQKTDEESPAIFERIANVESHLAVHYVPSPPANLLARIKFLEEHIIRLEKEYPPWAALHFNQLRRNWPPPPPSTPIIVPHHLRTHEQGASTTPQAAGGAKGKSSLTRAVMERLEVEKAMKDLESKKAG
ncbi:uncharacterized protein EV420DRAFT_1745013 [Desarmillaria tabescens]|uniref:Uncharacterized protein n=1 Tax=Armillaria tabescens TaxID=1929756 RepID=A0AA39NFK7_ARMTA|nr:uncharacterized protein EV420DRAFT_1745013 [Desarmillaria tabescens]KAK0464737.1 hypothetical protein EV420DRAFT_1745013 [Desarmillaria tabescens]